MSIESTHSLDGVVVTSTGGQRREDQIRAAETRLLYENAPTGIVATALIAALLAYAQSDTVPHGVGWAWLLYMLLVSVTRFVLVRQYWRASPGDNEQSRWILPFVAGTALAAAGWGATALVLNPSSQPMNETLIVFAVGGVMLGGASLLAARPEAFLPFLLLTGLPTALRLAAVGDHDHVLMGFSAAVFTVVTVVTTWRFHVAIESSLQLRFDKQDLIENLRNAKDHAEALNRDLELRIRDRTAKLIEADQRKDEFLATLAHELRNPLAPIRFALESLKTDAPATAARARDVIERQVTQLVRLVDDLLDVSRITANKILLRREPLDVGRLMATAVESIAPLAAVAGQTIDLEPPANALWVNGDGARLAQIFVNVLHNAVKFTPKGGQIWFTAEAQSHEAVIRIRDTGIGIAGDVLPHVFDMFHQAEPVTDRTTGGLGIGLTLARRLVEMHEGQISIRSSGPGRGTEVEIRLPITTAEATERVEADRPSAPVARTLRVLIVEDNVDAAEMLALAIATLGHEAELAHDGAAAIIAATQRPPDVIFLDIGLPGMNGYEVARRLRAMPTLGNVHIAAVTGWSQEEDRRRAREAGCDSHFTKPLSPSALEEFLVATAQRLQERAAEVSAPRHADSGGGS